VRNGGVAVLLTGVHPALLADALAAIRDVTVAIGGEIRGATAHRHGAGDRSVRK
jgi:hypothetical protein